VSLACVRAKAVTPALKRHATLLTAGGCPKRFSIGTNDRGEPDSTWCFVFDASVVGGTSVQAPIPQVARCYGRRWPVVAGTTCGTFGQGRSIQHPEYQWGSWDCLLLPYVKNDAIYQCPSCWLNETSTYCGNGNIFTNPCGQKISAINRPAQVLMVFDGNGEGRGRTIGMGNLYPFCRVCSKGYPQPGCADNTFLCWHAEGDNMSFADGHAKWYRTQDINDQYAGSTLILYTFKDISFDLRF